MTQDKTLKVEGPLYVVCQCNWCKAHPEQNLSCKSVQARLAAAWGYVKAQPEQEPVAWVSSEELLVMRGNALGGAKDWRINVGLVKQDGDVGLYTTPSQRPWVGLTDEELYEIYNKANWDVRQSWDYERAIEAKLKEKNT